MLSFISWPQYFAAILIMTLAYYGIVLAKYYRLELMGFVRAKSLPSTPTSTKFVGDFIGSIKPDPGESLINPEDIQFSDAEAESELINEIGALINAFKGLDQKDEFLTLLALILSRYVEAESNRPFIIEYVLQNSEALSFEVNLEDFEKAWSQTA